MARLNPRPASRTQHDSTAKRHYTRGGGARLRHVRVIEAENGAVHLFRRVFERRDRKRVVVEAIVEEKALARVAVARAVRVAALRADVVRGDLCVVVPARALGLVGCLACARPLGLVGCFACARALELVGCFACARAGIGRVLGLRALRSDIHRVLGLRALRGDTHRVTGLHAAGCARHRADDCDVFTERRVAENCW